MQIFYSVHRYDYFFFSARRVTREKSVDFQFVVGKLSRQDSSIFFVGVLNKIKRKLFHSRLFVYFRDNNSQLLSYNVQVKYFVLNATKLNLRLNLVNESRLLNFRSYFFSKHR